MLNLWFFSCMYKLLIVKGYECGSRLLYSVNLHRTEKQFTSFAGTPPFSVILPAFPFRMAFNTWFPFFLLDTWIRNVFFVVGRSVFHRFSDALQRPMTTKCHQTPAGTIVLSQSCAVNNLQYPAPILQGERSLNH